MVFVTLTILFVTISQCGNCRHCMIFVTMSGCNTCHDVPIVRNIKPMHCNKYHIVTLWRMSHRDIVTNTTSWHCDEYEVVAEGRAEANHRSGCWLVGWLVGWSGKTTAATIRKWLLTWLQSDDDDKDYNAVQMKITLRWKEFYALCANHQYSSQKVALFWNLLVKQ